MPVDWPPQDGQRALQDNIGTHMGGRILAGQKVQVGPGFSFAAHPDVKVLAGGEGGDRHGTIVSILPACLFVNWHAAASITEGAAPHGLARAWPVPCGTPS